MKTKQKTRVIFLLSLMTNLLFNSFFGFGQEKSGITTEKIEAIETFVQGASEYGQFSGMVLVAVDGEIIFNSAFGYANKEWNIPNTIDTKFRIASATKPFTAMLILQLVEEGKLQLEGILTDYLPEFPADKGGQITIHQLLTHTGGIISETQIPDLIDIEKLYYTRERLFDCIAMRPLSYVPGQGEGYSNFGFALLGLIIERVTGKSYGELLQERICNPAGMNNTMPDNYLPLIEKRAAGFNFDYINGMQHASHIDMSFVFAYGHLLSTAEDLYLFDEALYTNKLLSEESKRLFFNIYGGYHFMNYPYSKNNKYIYCNNLDASVNGFGCHMQRISGDHVFLCVLRNTKEDNNQIVVKWPDYIASPILSILYDEEYDPPKKSGAYQVFQVLLSEGISAAGDKLSEIQNGQLDQYYLDENEFIILAEYLSQSGKTQLAEAYRALIITSISEMTNKKSFMKTYPNPFSNSTSIEFQIKYYSNVNLKIFDLLGKEIKTLVDGYQTPGIKTIAWDGTDYSGNDVKTGVYNCSIQMGNENKSCRILKTNYYVTKDHEF
ncbi:serine hydrolase [Bacteroidota bacterium]